MSKASSAAERLARPSALVLVFYVIPVLGAPGRLTSPRLMALAAALFVVDLFQPSLKRTDTVSADRGSLHLLGVAAATAQLSPVIEWAYFSTAIPAMDGSIALGALLIVTGAALRLWAITTLGRFFSARVALQEQHRLVREGPYRWIRHPSYTGALLLLLGAPLLLQTPVSLGIAATALGIAYFRRITAEEALLRTHFGNAFECYERETKRLIPLLW